MFEYFEFKEGTNITYLELLKPNGQSMGELKNAYNRVTKLSLGEASELSFTLPNVQEIFMNNFGNLTEDEKESLIEEYKDFPVTNSSDIGKASLTLVGYKVKAEYSNGLKIIYTIPNKNISSDLLKVDTNFVCYSREYELARQLVIDYRGVLIDGKYVLDGLSLEEVMRDLLGGTFWTIDFLDEGFNNTDPDVIRRTIDAYNNISMLASIDATCLVFGAIPIYDTVNMKVSFYKADNYDYFKYNGLVIDDNNYMQEISQKQTTDEMVTRLYGLGKNNLTINGVNPTGVSYIEDLSYFLYPAKIGMGKNLFNKDDASKIKPIIVDAATLNIATSSASRSAVISCKPNTTYTVSRKILNNRFQVSSSVAYPDNGIIATGKHKSSYNNSTDYYLTYTTGANDNYLMVFFHNFNAQPGINYQDLLDGLMIEEGDKATSYVPYNPQTLLKSSKYMSDDLAKAELIYEDKVYESQSIFQVLYAEKDGYLKERIVLENQMTVLEAELKIIQDYIDVMFVGMNTATNSNSAYVAKRNELDAKQLQINAKQIEIDNKNSQINAVTLQLNTLYDSLKIENNFTIELLQERQNFIYEGLYTNTGIGIEQDLYDEMVEFLDKKKEPSIALDININSILSMKSKSAQRDADRVQIGEQIDIYYNWKGLDVDIRAQILELEIDEESNTMTLTIANTQDYRKSSADYLENILKRSITTSTMVDNNVIDWNKGTIALEEIDDIYQYGIDAAKIQIDSAADQSVTINDRGITIKDTTEPLRFLRATNGVLALTKDGGRTYSTAITPEGVFAERLIGQILLGSQLIIKSTDANTSLQISDIPANTYNDVNSALQPYGNDFGIVVKGPNNLIFVTRERGFKITTPTGKTLFEAKTDGVLRATGIEIISNNGKSILDGVNILQTWQDTISESLDSSYPMYQYFYLPTKTAELRDVRLSLRFLNYRAYSKSLQGGGSTTQSTTSGSGGGGTATGAGGTGATAHFHNTDADQIGSYVLYVSNSTDSAGLNYVRMGKLVGGTIQATFNAPLLMLNPDAYEENEWGRLYGVRSFNPTTTSGGGSDTMQSERKMKTNTTLTTHTHPVTLSSHTHSVSITLPDHTHGINFGIYEDTTPANVQVFVNGVNVGTTFTGTSVNIDIKNYVTRNGWNEIRITSSRLGRMQSSVFIQAMIGV